MTVTDRLDYSRMVLLIELIFNPKGLRMNPFWNAKDRLSQHRQFQPPWQHEPCGIYGNIVRFYVFFLLFMKYARKLHETALQYKFFSIHLQATNNRYKEIKKRFQNCNI